MSTALIPERCDSWDAWHACFKSAPPSLNTLRRGFTAAMQYVFSDPERYADYKDALACMVYSRDASKSTLSVEPGSSVDPGSTENIPGILVKMLSEGVRFEAPFFSPVISETEDTAGSSQVSLAKTSLVILCRNLDADMCCVMADVSAMVLFALRDRFMETFPWLLTFELRNQTEPKLTSVDQNNPTKWYESNVVFEIDYKFAVQVYRESKRFKDFSLETSQ